MKCKIYCPKSAHRGYFFCPQGRFAARISPKSGHRGYFFPPKEDRQLAPKGLCVMPGWAVRPEGLLRPVGLMGRHDAWAPAGGPHDGRMGRRPAGWAGKEKREERKVTKRKKRKEKGILNLALRACCTALRALCTLTNLRFVRVNLLHHLHLLQNQNTQHPCVVCVTYTPTSFGCGCTFRVRCRRHRTYTLCEVRSTEHYKHLRSRCVQHSLGGSAFPIRRETVGFEPYTALPGSQVQISCERGPQGRASYATPTYSTPSARKGRRSPSGRRSPAYSPFGASRSSFGGKIAPTGLLRLFFRRKKYPLLGFQPKKIPPMGWISRKLGPEMRELSRNIPEITHFQRISQDSERHQVDKNRENSRKYATNLPLFSQIWHKSSRFSTKLLQILSISWNLGEKQKLLRLSFFLQIPHFRAHFEGFSSFQGSFRGILAQNSHKIPINQQFLLDFCDFQMYISLSFSMEIQHFCHKLHKNVSFLAQNPQIWHKIGTKSLDLAQNSWISGKNKCF